MVSDDIKIEFDLDRCTKATFKREKKAFTEGFQLTNNVMKELETEAT